MGDDPENAPSKPVEHHENEEKISSESISPSSRSPALQSTPGTSAKPTAFHSQYNVVPSQQARNQPTNQFNPSTGRNSQSPFNMSGMTSTLPEYTSPHSQNYRQPQMGSQSPQAPVYGHQQGMPYPPGGPYPASPAYTGYNQPQYGSPFTQPQGSPQLGQQMGFPYPPPQRPSGSLPQGTQYPQYYYYQDPYGRPSGSPSTYQPPPSVSSSYPVSLRMGAPAIVSDSMGGSPMSGPSYSPSVPFEEARLSSESSATAAIPRGPPRKPKQSGHALWVGNLPPGATITDLKDHFSRDLTKDIESLFLISKSNCAFVNYRSEEACTKAMQRFHDSRFQGVRLVCRPRKPSASGPSGGSSATPKSPLAKNTPVVDTEEIEDEDEQSTVPEEASKSRVAERYFIVKSLTLQDLEQSVRNGIWATQSHNENALNRAYNNADNVYLIFSANKSGEYFGYARMTSSIAENAAEIFGTIHRTDVTELTDAPKEISTPATEFAPKGRIIDDSARGTIFWEAELSDNEEIEEEKLEIPDPIDIEPPTWGKPFKIEWLSTNRVPFFRTRGLRNPWNANREVKIARDGTELEPSVGKRLIQLFHRPGSTSAASGSIGAIAGPPFS